MKPVVLVGGGGHARVIRDTLEAAGRTLIGVVDRDPAAIQVSGVNVLGDDSAALALAPESVEMANGVGGIGDTLLRRQVFEKFKAHGFTFATVIHPSAVVALDVQLGEGCQVMAGAVVQTGVVIGRNAIVNTRTCIDHDSRIGDHCHIAPGVILCGNVCVGAGSHIGAGAVIVQGAEIGPDSFVKAGALVSQRRN